MRNIIVTLTPFALCAGLALLVGGCQNTSPSNVASKNPSESKHGVHATQQVDSFDSRIPVPLLPRMAAHQRENMRDHLAAVQEIIAAVAAEDFAGVATNAARIGYSEEMGRMCSHMGAGAPGFNELALNFHNTEIGFPFAYFGVRCAGEIPLPPRSGGELLNRRRGFWCRQSKFLLGMEKWNSLSITRWVGSDFGPRIWHRS